MWNVLLNDLIILLGFLLVFFFSDWKYATIFKYVVVILLAIAFIIDFVFVFQGIGRSREVVN